jgi:hypothetical protein
MRRFNIIIDHGKTGANKSKFVYNEREMLEVFPELYHAVVSRDDFEKIEITYANSIFYAEVIDE